jgi:hypothetical protein
MKMFDNPRRPRNGGKPYGYWTKYAEDILNQLTPDLSGDDKYEWLVLNKCKYSSKFVDAVFRELEERKKVKYLKVKKKVLGKATAMQTMSGNTGLTLMSLFGIK